MDDLKKVKRAIDLIGAAENGSVNVRLSSGSSENSDEICFAYLPKRLLPEISKMLLWAESGRTRRTRRTGKAVAEEFRQYSSGKTTV